MSGLGTLKFTILTFWMAPWETSKTSLKSRVSTHFRCPWAGGHKSLFQDGEYATVFSQSFHHRFLRCKPCWIPRMTLQMCSKYENHNTKASLGAPEGFVNRFVTLFTMQTILDTENYATNVVRVRKSRYKSWLGCLRRLCEQICHAIYGTPRQTPV